MKQPFYLLLILTTITIGNAIENQVSTTDDDITIDTIDYKSPEIQSTNIYLSEHFDNLEKFQKKWIPSQAKKINIDETISQYDGKWSIEPSQRDNLAGDYGLVLKTKAKHAAISTKLFKPFKFFEKPLIIQYEVQFQDGQECGGAYIKLLTNLENLEEFHDKTSYIIMFGPDKCGNDQKIHFIFKHRNPINGSFEEKHLKKLNKPIDDLFNDHQPHLYTLIINSDNTFLIKIDKNVIKNGNLLEDFEPSVNPSKTIKDPNDHKPIDWDEREKIPDPTAVKPDDWDENVPAQIEDKSVQMPDGWLENEPTHIPDPNAQKPEDWDMEMDGEWEPPLIENPKCLNAIGCGTWNVPLINNPEFKGKWRAPLIDNPNYKGKWKAREILNPDYFEDLHPFKMDDIDAVGFELWSMSKDILFDNIIITDELLVAEQWAEATFDKKQQKIARDAVTFWGRFMKKINYKPYAWIVYGIYCSIPIGCYILYLYKCLNEESVVQKLANLTNQYPLLWALYIIILGIPVVFVLYICHKPSSAASQVVKENDELDEEAKKKKTDLPTEDDVVVDEEAKKKKTDLSTEDENRKIEENVVDKEKYSDSDSDDDDDGIEEIPDKKNSPKKDDGGGGDVARKRKVRKE